MGRSSGTEKNKRQFTSWITKIRVIKSNGSANCPFLMIQSTNGSPTSMTKVNYIKFLSKTSFKSQKTQQKTRLLLIYYKDDNTPKIPEHPVCHSHRNRIKFTFLSQFKGRILRIMRLRILTSRDQKMSICNCIRFIWNIRSYSKKYCRSTKM